MLLYVREYVGGKGNGRREITVYCGDSGFAVVELVRLYFLYELIESKREFNLIQMGEDSHQTHSSSTHMSIFMYDMYYYYCS